MNKYTKYLIAIILLALAGTLFYNKVYIPKTSYTLIQAKKDTLRVSISGIGNVGAKNVYAITAQTGGKILAIHTDNGEWVKKGDLLIEMDGVDLPALLAVAQASLQKAEFDIKASKNDLNNQKAQKKLLQITYDRYAKLKEQKFASQAEYDKAKADLDSIDAAISASKAHINSAKAAALIASKNVDAIQTKIDRLKVYAPVDGYVISRDAEVAQNVVASTPILQIVDPTTLWVATKVDERVSADIRLGQSANITLRSQPNKHYKGIVKRINAMSDAVTLEREIDVAFLEIPKPFYMNEQAKTSIDIRTLNDVVTVPAKVVVQNGGELGVWVAKDSHAHFVKLDIIDKNDNSFAVRNLDESMQIITPSNSKKPLSDGMKIHQ